MHRRAGSLAVSLAAALTGLALLVLGAVAAYRQATTRGVRGQLQDAQLLRVAEAAIAEVADGPRLEAAYGADGYRGLAAAFRTGTHFSGVLTPSGGRLSLDPTETRAAYAAEPGVTVGPVRVIPLEYSTFRRSGRFRFVVTVEVRRGSRAYRRTVSEDYEALLYASGDRLRVRLGRGPIRRLTA